MEPGLQRCWHCDADTTRDREAGLTYCAACGRGLSRLVSVTDDQADRERWRLCFWLIAMINPVVVIVAGASLDFLHRFVSRNVTAAGVHQMLKLAPLGIAGVLALGCVAAGYCLMKLNGVPASRSGAVVRVIWNAVLIFLATLLGITLMSVLL